MSLDRLLRTPRSSQNRLLNAVLIVPIASLIVVTSSWGSSCSSHPAVSERELNFYRGVIDCFCYQGNHFRNFHEHLQKFTEPCCWHGDRQRDRQTDRQIERQTNMSVGLNNNNNNCLFRPPANRTQMHALCFSDLDLDPTTLIYKLI